VELEDEGLFDMELAKGKRKPDGFIQKQGCVRRSSRSEGFPVTRLLPRWLLTEEVMPAFPMPSR